MNFPSSGSALRAIHILAGRWGALALLFCSVAFCFGQPKGEIRRPPPLDVAAAEKAGAALAADLLSQRPAQSSTNTGVLVIRDPEGQTEKIAARFELLATPTNTVTVYDTTVATNRARTMLLTVSQTPGQPNQYLLQRPGDARPKPASGSELMTPFAGSDFCLADLGLEFLHWPTQRLLKKEMRQSLFCDVLESVNPAPAPGGYSRVVSWVAADKPGVVLVRAEAYDAGGKLLKLFEPRKVEKVNGEWQLESMQIINRQTHSRTRIEFNFKAEP